MVEFLCLLDCRPVAIWFGGLECFMITLLSFAYGSEESICPQAFAFIMDAAQRVCSLHLSLWSASSCWSSIIDCSKLIISDSSGTMLLLRRAVAHIISDWDKLWLVIIVIARFLVWPCLLTRTHSSRTHVIEVVICSRDFAAVLDGCWRPLWSLSCALNGYRVSPWVFLWSFWDNFWISHRSLPTHAALCSLILLQPLKLHLIYTLLIRLSNSRLLIITVIR